MERPVKPKEKMNGTAWERFEAEDSAMCQLTSQFFSYLQALLGSTGLCTLDNGKLLGCNAVIQLLFPVLALPLVFSLLAHRVDQPLHVE